MTGQQSRTTGPGAPAVTKTDLVDHFVAHGPHKVEWIYKAWLREYFGVSRNYFEPDKRRSAGAGVKGSTDELVNMLRDTLMESPQFSRTNQALPRLLATRLAKQRPTNWERSVRTLADDLFDLGYQRITSSDEPFGGLRGRLTWWALDYDRSKDELVSGEELQWNQISRDSMQRELHHDELDLAAQYRRLFEHYGIPVPSEGDAEKLVSFVHTVSALFDGMLIRASVDGTLQPWKGRFATGLVHLVRGVAHDATES